MRGNAGDDFLDEMIAERALANPAVPALLGAAVQRRQAETEPVADDAPEAQTGRKRTRKTVSRA